MGSARDRLRNDLNERLKTSVLEDSRRFDAALERSTQADAALKAAQTRVQVAEGRRAETAAKAEQLEKEAEALPVDAGERAEKLELAAKLRIAAESENALIQEAQARIAPLQAEAAAQEAALEAAVSVRDAGVEKINAAEDQIDRLEEKIRLFDREQDALASAREAENDAASLATQGDETGAAASRQEAARLRADGEQAARDNALISIDSAPLTDAGLTVPGEIEMLAAAGPTAAEQLNERAFGLAEQAADLRKQLTATTEAKFTEIGIARDRAAREQYAAEQSAKSADLQIQREHTAAKELNDAAAQEDAKATAASTRGDDRAVEAAQESALTMRSSAGVHTNRARQAEADAAELRAAATAHGQRVAELEAQKATTVEAGRSVEEQLDKMEDQARLLLEASQKTEEAARLPPQDPRSASLKAEAEAAVQQAQQLQPDHAQIRVILPEAQIDAAATPVMPEPSTATATADAPVGSGDDDLALSMQIDGVDQSADLTTDLTGLDTGMAATADGDIDASDDAASVEPAASGSGGTNEIAMDDTAGGGGFVPFSAPDVGELGVPAAEFEVPDVAPVQNADAAGDIGSDFAAPAAEQDSELADDVATFDDA